MHPLPRVVLTSSSIALRAAYGNRSPSTHIQAAGGVGVAVGLTSGVGDPSGDGDASGATVGIGVGLGTFLTCGVGVSCGSTIDVARLLFDEPNASKPIEPQAKIPATTKTNLDLIRVASLGI